MDMQSNGFGSTQFYRQKVQVDENFVSFKQDQIQVYSMFEQNVVGLIGRDFDMLTKPID